MSESAGGPTPPSNHNTSDPASKPKILTGRPAGACMRCKGRKIKCGCEKPACAGCLKAKVECQYPFLDHVDVDLIRILESRLEAVESVLSSSSQRTPKRQRTTNPDSIDNDPPSPRSPVRRHRTSLPPHSFRFEPPSSAQALYRLPGSAELDGLHLDQVDVTDDHINMRPIRHQPHSIPPSHEVMAAVDHFLSYINPAFPILHGPTFLDQVRTLYVRDPSPPASILSAVHVIIAIHTLSNGRQDPDLTESRQKARGHYTASLKYLDLAWKSSHIGHLQNILLRAQYVLRDPNMGDIWDTVGRAVRMAIDLGLHLDPQSSLQALSPLEIDIRRRLFWVTYTSECKIAIALGRPTGFNNDWISTQFPSIYADDAPRDGERTVDHRKEAGIHHFQYRILQSEINDRLNTVAAGRSPSPTPEWFEQMSKRLDEWRTRYKSVTGEYISEEWLENSYQILRSVLHRPCPGNPRPSKESLCKAVTAASSIVRIYKSLWRRRTINFTWLGIHHVFMAGVTYLSSIWIANQENWTIIPSYVDAILDIQSCSQVLESMSAVERGTERMRDAFETVSARIIQHLSSQNGSFYNPSASITPFDLNAFLTVPDAAMPFFPVDSSTNPTSQHDDNVPVQNPSSNLLPAALLTNGDGSLPLGTGAIDGLNLLRQPDSQLTVPTAMDTVDKFFSNPFIDLGPVDFWNFSMDTFTGLPERPEEA